MDWKLPKNAFRWANDIRFFGDGYQKSKIVAERRYWRIPVMDGEFLVEESVGISKGVAGGNVILQTIDQRSGLDAARRASEAVSAPAECHRALSRRSCSQRQQSWIAIQGSASFDRRRLLPNATGTR